MVAEEVVARANDLVAQVRPRKPDELLGEGIRAVPPDRLVPIAREQDDLRLVQPREVEGRVDLERIDREDRVDGLRLRDVPRVASGPFDPDSRRRG